MCNVKKAAVFFGTGYEEIEALTVVDLLRRAGIEVTCVAIDGQKQVMGAHHINVDMDAAIEGLDFDSPSPSENAYMKRYSVANYAHRMRAGLAR